MAEEQSPTDKQEDDQVKNLEQLLERMEQAAEEQEQVSIGSIMEAIGSRSFGPLLLFAGVILFSPLSGMPGMPTTMSLLVLLIAIQLLMRRDHFWLPHWIINRSMHQKKIKKVVRKLWRPARFIDRLLKPRLKKLTHSGGTRAVAVLCILLALFTPAMEVVPFSASIAGAAIAAFALSLITEDGLLALIAFVLAASVVGLIISSIFFAAS